MVWVQALRKVDDKEKKTIPPLILSKNEKGEIREDTENVPLEKFCLAMKLPKV